MFSFIKKYFLKVTLLVIIISLASCDKGIEPYPDKTVMGETGFEGKVTFIGDWPEGITRTYLVVFTEPSKFDVNTLYFLIGPIPYGTREYNYNSTDNNSGLIPKLEVRDYPYVIVAQSKTEVLSLTREDWTVAGIYFNDGETTTPGLLKIEQGKITTGVDIICDFNNPPVQPPAKWIFEHE